MHANDYIDYLNNNIHALAWELTSDRPHTSDFTKRITYALGKSLHETGAIAEPEKKLPITRQARRKNGSIDHKFGHLDLLGLFPDLSSIAVEFDRTNKAWSLDKLVCAKMHFGSAGVWIRWKGAITLEVPSNLTLIDLSFLSDRISIQPSNYSYKHKPFDFI